MYTITLSTTKEPKWYSYFILVIRKAAPTDVRQNRKWFYFSKKIEYLQIFLSLPKNQQLLTYISMKKQIGSGRAYFNWISNNSCTFTLINNFGYGSRKKTHHMNDISKFVVISTERWRISAPPFQLMENLTVKVIPSYQIFLPWWGGHHLHWPKFLKRELRKLEQSLMDRRTNFLWEYHYLLATETPKIERVINTSVLDLKIEIYSLPFVK